MAAEQSVACPMINPSAPSLIFIPDKSSKSPSAIVKVALKSVALTVLSNISLVPIESFGNTTSASPVPSVVNVIAVVLPALPKTTLVALVVPKFKAAAASTVKLPVVVLQTDAASAVNVIAPPPVPSFMVNPFPAISIVVAASNVGVSLMAVKSISSAVISALSMLAPNGLPIATTPAAPSPEYNVSLSVSQHNCPSVVAAEQSAACPITNPSAPSLIFIFDKSM